jgi:hypothetical protein
MIMFSGQKIGGGDTPSGQNAATVFLVKREIPTSDVQTQFTLQMETPAWALAVSEDSKSIIKTGEPTTAINPPLADRKLPLPKEERKMR